MAEKDDQKKNKQQQNKPTATPTPPPVQIWMAGPLSAVTVSIKGKANTEYKFVLGTEANPFVEDLLNGASLVVVKTDGAGIWRSQPNIDMIATRPQVSSLSRITVQELNGSGMSATIPLPNKDTASASVGGFGISKPVPKPDFKVGPEHELIEDEDMVFTLTITSNAPDTPLTLKLSHKAKKVDVSATGRTPIAVTTVKECKFITGSDCVAELIIELNLDDIVVEAEFKPQTGLSVKRRLAYK